MSSIDSSHSMLLNSTALGKTAHTRLTSNEINESSQLAKEEKNIQLQLNVVRVIPAEQITQETDDPHLLKIVSERMHDLATNRHKSPVYLVQLQPEIFDNKDLHIQLEKKPLYFLTAQALIPGDLLFGTANIKVDQDIAQLSLNINQLTLNKDYFLTQQSEQKSTITKSLSQHPLLKGETLFHQLVNEILNLNIKAHNDLSNTLSLASQHNKDYEPRIHFSQTKSFNTLMQKDLTTYTHLLSKKLGQAKPQETTPFSATNILKNTQLKALSLMQKNLQQITQTASNSAPPFHWLAQNPQSTLTWIENTPQMIKKNTSQVLSHHLKIQADRIQTLESTVNDIKHLQQSMNDFTKTQNAYLNAHQGFSKAHPLFSQLKLHDTTQSAFIQLHETLLKYWDQYRSASLLLEKIANIPSQQTSMTLSVEPNIHFYDKNILSQLLEQFQQMNRLKNIKESTEQTYDFLNALITRTHLTKVFSESVASIVHSEEAQQNQSNTGGLSLNLPISIDNQVSWLRIQIDNNHQASENKEHKARSIDLEFNDQQLGRFLVRMSFPKGFHTLQCETYVFIERNETLSLFDQYQDQLVKNIQKTGLQIQSVHLLQTKAVQTPTSIKEFYFHEEA